MTAVAAAGEAPAGPVEAAVEIDGLVKRYAGRTILDGVALHVGRGEIVALLGPNGAGKTTTVEIIEGYRRADGGTVRVLGMDPARGGAALRARVGLMLQGGGIDPRSRPLETVRLYAAFHDDPRNPDALIDLVGLRPVADTRYRLLSGGERQRLGLALALVGRPELVILDEPTAGMDPAAKALTRALVADLRSDGLAVLLTTHDLTDVERLADRVAILDRGRIVAEGSPAELAGGTEARLRFRLAAPLATSDVEVLGSALGGAVVAEADDAFARYRVVGVAADPTTVAALAAWCAGRAIRIIELRTTGGTLEERYLELTGDPAVDGATRDEP